MSDKIYGIDLGTSNSCIAVMEAAGPRVIPIDGQPTVPSVVGYDRRQGEILVGQRARNRMALEPESTVRSIKRRMGLSEPSRLGPRQLSPEEVAAEILRYLKDRGGAAEEREIRRAVITVPAYFEDAQRRATVRAGELAGLEVVRLLNEPTAAALIYDRLQVRSPEDGTAPRTGRGDDDRVRILVYDLGGGTFDVSVVEISHQIDEVLASCGDNHLGGDDFDQLLVEHLLRHVENRHGRDLAGDSRALARLAAAAELAKIDLSSKPYSRVIEEALAGGLHLDVELERATLEGLIGEALDGTMPEVERALEEARLAASEIDRVVLVGGSTRIPRVREMLGERFACPVEHAVDPALCVGLGAAVQGAILEGEIYDQILVDVAAHSLGVKTLDDPTGALDPLLPQVADFFSPVIRRNTQIPVTRSEVYYTVVDDQRAIDVEVYQGDQPRCSQNTRIGNFLFELEPCPAGSPVVEELSYDTDGIIQVRVHQKGTGNSAEATFDTRVRPAAGGAPAPSDGERVDNYMIRKARKLSADLPEGDLRRRLEAAADAYEALLAKASAEPAEVDRLEDELLERLDETEEALAPT